MKIKYFASAILFAIVTIVSNTSFSAIKDQNSTVISEAKNFNKIEVRGNVEVYLMDGNENSVKTFNNYYGESALVQNQNNTLRISSYTKDALVVYVTVADLRSLSVYDNAIVKSGKDFSSIEIEINLYNNATAQLNLQAFNATINVNDSAKANLSGNVTNCNMQINRASTVNTTNFVAEHIDRKEKGIAAIVVAKADDSVVM